MESRENLCQHINNLPGRLVKEVLLEWVSSDPTLNVDALDQALSSVEISYPYSPEAFQEDDEACKHFENTGEGYDNQSVFSWLDYANREIRIGIDAADQGDFFEGILEDLNQKVLSEDSH